MIPILFELCEPQVGSGVKATTRTRAQNPLPEFFEVAVEVQTTIILAFLSYKYISVYKQCLIRKYFLTAAYLGQKRHF